VKFSELHAIDLVDMDGDGVKDIVTGKRFWSHGRTGDPDRNDKAVLYWFKTARGADKSVDFIPYLIDDNSGVGVQVVASDMNGDGLADIVVGNKKGTFVHLHEKKTVSREEWQKAQPKLFTPASASVK
jgi:FG-GAP repeat